jgi:hypothetical protein
MMLSTNDVVARRRHFDFVLVESAGGCFALSALSAQKKNMGGFARRAQKNIFSFPRAARRTHMSFSRDARRKTTWVFRAQRAEDSVELFARSAQKKS